MTVLMCRFVILLLCMMAASALHGATVDGVVLVISDGTSNELLTAARIYRHGIHGKLAMEELPQTAFVKTASLSHVVTDSGAAATAMARGEKADNRVVGLVGRDERPAPSILDLAKKAGWSTAVV